MKKKIFYFINLIFFFISLLYIVNIINDNYDYFKISLAKIGYVYFITLIILAILINFFGNNLNYNISINFLRKISFIRFTEINLISNLINEVIPFFGMMYKGYIFEKFKLSYFNYFNTLILWKILNIYFLFFLAFFFILIFEDKFYFKFIAISIIVIQFIILNYYKSLTFKKTFIQNKYLDKFKIYIFSYTSNKIIKIIIYLLLMHFVNFIIYYLLIDNFISLNLKGIIVTYILRNFIILIPFLNTSPVVILVSTFIFSVLDLDLSFFESFFLNLSYNIIITFGAFSYLCLVFFYKILKKINSLKKEKSE